ncbi:MAG: hypothetical protein Q9193_000257, partial [Seirophora villosa]
AETDRDQVRRYWADQGREQELLGKTTKVYHSDRYARLLMLLAVSARADADRVRSRFVRPTYGVTPSHISE